jgi:hypothetical protein
MSVTNHLTLSPVVLLVLAACTNDLTVANESDLFSGARLAESLLPNRNLEIILLPVAGGTGFGLVKFRQPKDEAAIVELDTWVRGLSPNTSYQLQRATDAVVDDVCAGTNWLTLGQGTTPRAILTDEQGTGREALSRDLSAVAPGTAFDIHFRVIDEAGVAVLQSGCYQFIVSL